MATKRRVEQGLRQLIARAGSLGDSMGSLPERRLVALHLPDLDASYWIELVDGTVGPLRRGAPENPHIRVRVSSDELVDLVEGRSDLAAAFLSGAIRVDAPLGDLLALRKLIP